MTTPRTVHRSPPSFLKKDDVLAAIMRCRLLLANSQFDPLCHVDCGPRCRFPFTDLRTSRPDLRSTLDHLAMCRFLNPFSQCNNLLRSYGMSPLTNNSLLVLPKSSRFVTATSSLLRSLYFFAFPP